MASRGQVPKSSLGKLYFQDWSDTLQIFVLKPLTHVQEAHVRRVEDAQICGNIAAAGVTGEDKVDGAWFFISYIRRERFINFHGVDDTAFNLPVLQLILSHDIDHRLE